MKKKHRVTLEMTARARARVKRLMDLGDTESMSEVIRRALAAYEMLLEHEAAGGRVVLRSDAGEEVLRVVP